MREHPSRYASQRVTYVESSALVRALLDADTDVADVLGEPPQLVRVVTRDERVAANARALGYAVV